MEKKNLLTAIAVAIGTITVGAVSFLAWHNVNAEPTRLEVIQAELGVFKADLADCQSKWQAFEDEQSKLKAEADGLRLEISKLEQEASDILGL